VLDEQSPRDPTPAEIVNAISGSTLPADWTPDKACPGGICPVCGKPGDDIGGSRLVHAHPCRRRWWSLVSAARLRAEGGPS
jgi:hypothetical protein